MSRLVVRKGDVTIEAGSLGDVERAWALVTQPCAGCAERDSQAQQARQALKAAEGARARAEGELAAVAQRQARQAPSSDLGPVRKALGLDEEDGPRAIALAVEALQDQLKEAKADARRLRTALESKRLRGNAIKPTR